MDILYFTVVFIFKILQVYALPASHLEVHAWFENWLAGEQMCFCGFILLLVGIFYLQLHGLADEQSMAW
jgi:hypothetical protein